MTMHMQYRTTRFGSWTDFDIVANGVMIQTILHTYSAASRMDFYVTAPEQTQPIPQMAWVQVWDDVGLDDSGTAFSSSNPLFLGIVANITPGDHSNQVRYVAFDPTYFAAKSVTVMSLPYQAQTSPIPVPATGAVPRLVYNVANVADDDYAFEAGQNLTTGNIIAGLLDYCLQPLYWLGCGGSGSAAYNAADLTGMTFVPQEKMVWESLTIRAALEQVWRAEPRYRMFYRPDSQLFRFYLLSGGTAKTLYLNDSGHTTTYPVVGCEIKPTFEDCATAVSIYGPPDVQYQEFTWDSVSGGTLTPLGSPIILQNYSDSGGMHNAQTYTGWQITDPTKRAGARMFPVDELVPMGGAETTTTRFPMFLLSWDHGTSYLACSGVKFDFLNGIASFGGGNVPYLVITDQNAPSVIPGSTQTVFPPNAVKLCWAEYKAPLQVRYPSSGFSGTAYTLFGCETEYRLYDESLAIGREFGTPVTSSARQAQFTALAQYIQSTRCDVIYTGTIVLAGCDYSYSRLNRVINIANAATGGSTTGWESINAVVTDVEYTYGENPSTTLTINANWLELYGQNPAELREKLRIRSFNQYSYAQLYGSPYVVPTGFQTIQNYNGSTYQQATGVAVYNPYIYIDQFGHREVANIS